MTVSDLINTINATADSPGDLKDDERAALQAACDKLKTKLETPRETGLRIIFSVCILLHAVECMYVCIIFANLLFFIQPVQAIALRLAVDMKLFDAAASLSASKDEDQVHVDDLATETGADKLLVGKQADMNERSVWRAYSSVSIKSAS